MSLRRALACWAAAALLLAGCGGSDEPTQGARAADADGRHRRPGRHLRGVGRRLRARHHQAARGLPRRRHPHHGLGREPRAPARRPGADRAHARRHRARRRRGSRGVRSPRGAQGARPDLPELRPGRHARGARASARSPTSRASASASARPTPAPRWSPTACSTSPRSAGSSAAQLGVAESARRARARADRRLLLVRRRADRGGRRPLEAHAGRARRPAPLRARDAPALGRRLRRRDGPGRHLRARLAGEHGHDPQLRRRGRRAWTPRSRTT